MSAADPGDHRPPLQSFYRSQQVTRIHGRIFAHAQLPDDTFLWRFDFVLHFHRFHHQKALICLDLSALRNKKFDDFPRHWRPNLNYTVMALQTGPQSCGPPVDHLNRNAVVRKRNDKLFTVPGYRDLQRAIVPIEPIDSRLNHPGFQQVLSAADFSLDAVSACSVQFNFDSLAVNDRGVLHEVLSPRRRPSSFQGLSASFATSARGPDCSE